MTARRILFHVQHLLGIGHWRRAVLIARGLHAAGFEVTVLNGGTVESHAPEPFEIVALPEARSADASFSSIVDRDGRPIDDAFRGDRRDRVLAAFRRVEPDIVLIESFPFGRRAFRFELLPLIAAARVAVPRPLLVASIRDVLVARDDPARIDDIVATVARDFDAVLVHGDPAVIALEASFGGASRIARKLHYTGYVSENDAAIDKTGIDQTGIDATGSDGAGEVIVSAGGGAVGAALFRAALAARALSPLAAARWRFLAGPHLAKADFAALAAARSETVVVERFRRDFRTLLRRCTLSISQAGYNTTLDLLDAGARGIVVPFAAGRETEQATRAALLAERGVLQFVPEAQLSGERLAAAITAAVAAAPPRRLALRRDGAAATAVLLDRLLTSQPRSP